MGSLWEGSLWTTCCPSFLQPRAGLSPEGTHARVSLTAAWPSLVPPVVEFLMFRSFRSFKLTTNARPAGALVPGSGEGESVSVDSVRDLSRLPSFCEERPGSSSPARLPVLLPRVGGAALRSVLGAIGARLYAQGERQRSLPAHATTPDGQRRLGTGGDLGWPLCRVSGHSRV